LSNLADKFARENIVLTGTQMPCIGG